METFSVIALVVGLGGAALVVLVGGKPARPGHWQSMPRGSLRNHNGSPRRAAQCRKGARPPREPVRSVLRGPGKKSEGPRASRAQADKSANIVVRPGGSPGHELPTIKGPVPDCSESFCQRRSRGCPRDAACTRPSRMAHGEAQRLAGPFRRTKS